MFQGDFDSETTPTPASSGTTLRQAMTSVGYAGSTICASAGRLSAVTWTSTTSFNSPASFSSTRSPIFFQDDSAGTQDSVKGNGEFKNNRNTFAGLYIQDNY